MMALFDEEYIQRAYHKRIAREAAEEARAAMAAEVAEAKAAAETKAAAAETKAATAVRTVAETYQEFGLSLEEAVKKVAVKFNLPKAEAQEAVERCWS